MFKKATKQHAKLRLGLLGPAGSGKTYTALTLASELGQRVAVIDTERGSASLYADRFGFDVAELEDFDPRRYIEAIQAAEAAGYDVIVIDSLSHAWSGKGGALDLVDAASRRSKSGNNFMAWREVTPLHNALVEAMLQTKAHVIATLRTKVEYIVEQVNGRSVPRKVGMAPIQRDGLDYEFTVVGELDHEHHLTITKTRCVALADKSYQLTLGNAGKDIAGALKAWLSDGTPPTQINEAPVTAAVGQTGGAAQPPGPRPSNGVGITDAQRRRLFALGKAAGLDVDGIKATMARLGLPSSTKQITAAQYEALCSELSSEPSADPDGYGSSLVEGA